MQTRRPRWPSLAGPAVASLTSPTSPIPSSRGRRSHGPTPPREKGVAVSGLGRSAAPDAQDDGSRGSVAKMEMVNPMALIYKTLFPSISTFEPPPLFLVLAPVLQGLGIEVGHHGAFLARLAFTLIGLAAFGFHPCPALPTGASHNRITWNLWQNSILN